MGLLKTLFGQDPFSYEKRGDKYLIRGDWGMAKIEFENALEKLERSSPLGQAYKARLIEKLYRSKEALARKHLQDCDQLIESEFYDDARELLEIALDLAQDTALIKEINTLLGEIERHTKNNTPETLEEYEDIDENHSPEDGDEYFIALCGTLPEDIRIKYLSYGESFKAGYMALNRGEFLIAVEYLSNALEKQPDPESYIRLELASAYLNLNKLDEARQLLETFLYHHPDKLPGYQLLCEVFWETNAFDLADELLAKCPDELKDSTAYFILKGENMLQAGNYQASANFYQDFLKDYGWKDPIARELAKAFEMMDKKENAWEIYSRIMTECRSCHAQVDPFIQRKYADLSFELGKDLKGALEIYLSFVREDPENRSFYYQRASRLFSLLNNEVEAKRFREFARQAQLDENSPSNFPIANNNDGGFRLNPGHHQSVRYKAPRSED